MLTDRFYQELATLLKGGSQEWGPLSIAIGQGEQSWDRTPPLMQRGIQTLVHEVARQIINAQDIVYLNDENEVSVQATPRLRIQTNFPAEIGTGTLRECGLLLGVGDAAVLLAYFIHPRIEKLSDATLTRHIQLDLRPGKVLPEELPTRYLGNTKSEEFHDLENTSAACQLNEIRIDRRHYFVSIDEALALGYDYCAFCFSKELSQR